MGLKPKAFTLIELIVVIAVIGVILVISIVSFSTTRLKARDTQRLSDIVLLQDALEKYYRDEGVYPPSLTPGEALIGLTSSTTYLTMIPQNPSPRSDNDCTDSEYVYNYKSGDNTYEIDFCLGGTTGNYVGGAKCARPSGISDGACFVCGESTISYAGESYNTVQINTQCWLAQNLNVGTMISDPTTCIVGASTCAADPDNNFDYNNIEKYCYNNTENNCTNFGALYSWTEAFALPHSCKDVSDYVCNVSWGCLSASTPDCNFPLGHQGICPPSWHLPSEAEFSSLIAAMTGDPSLAPYFTSVAPGYLYHNNSYYDGNSYVYYYYLYFGLTWATKNASNLNWTGYNMTGYPHAGWAVRCLKD